jgi:hypothetical protein
MKSGGGGQATGWRAAGATLVGFSTSLERKPWKKSQNTFFILFFGVRSFGY